MWGEHFIRLKSEVIEIILTIKRMILNPISMILNFLWIIITFQEQNWVNNVKQLAEDERNTIDHQMPNECVQGVALTVCATTDFQFNNAYFFNFRLKYVHHHL